MSKHPRAGKGLLPPNSKQWKFENHALDVRDRLGLEITAPLDPRLAFSRLLQKVLLVSLDQFALQAEVLNILRRQDKIFWSGIGIPLPDGRTLVTYNDSQPRTRLHATLMEEFFHIYLNHPPSVIRLHDGKGRSRNANVETEAYHCGAAALLPYAGLKALLREGIADQAIADHYSVSADLVLFRMKVTRLFRKTKK